MVLPALRRVLGPLHYTSYLKRIRVGDLVVIIEPSLIVPYPTAILSDIYMTILNYSLGVVSSPRSIWSSRKTAITTPFGLFEFPYMSFGLWNAAQTFQRFMDEVLRGLDFCFAYLDDILVYSHSLEEHGRHLRVLFSRLNKYGIIIFRATEVTFLGYKVTAQGYEFV
jgi:hypothetical protein